MRSVYVFVGAPADEVHAHLDTVASRNPAAAQWFYPDRDRRALYIELTDRLLDELEPEVQRAVIDSFGGERPRCICIDVSGRASGAREEVAVASGILRRFGGVAMNDEDDHLWTLAKIEADQATNHGRRFAGG
jgi:hypothetical protein